MFVNLALRLACLAVILTGAMIYLSSSLIGSHAASNGPNSTEHSKPTDNSVSTPGVNASSTSVPAEPNGQQQKEARISEAYGKLPLSFEANQGQADSQVKFISRGSGYSLFLTSTEAVLALSRPLKPEGSNHLAGGQKAPDAQQSSTSSAVLRMKLLGANPYTQVSGVEKQPGQTNYFIGNDRTRWRTNIQNYAQVKYESVYPGIDIIYYGNQRQLEYDFVVAPGANPDRIRLAFAGADKMFLDANGELVLKTAVGQVRQHKPVMYQEVNGTRREIAGRYVIKGREVGFEIGDYDRSSALVIDPVLVYSTYLGGTSTDRGYSIAVDSSGNAYVAGNTYSGNFPTLNQIQPPHNLSSFTDAFIVKINPSGSALVYGTYLGGTMGEAIYGVAVDGGGNAYVTGSTGSSDFPTANALQPINKGNGDIFVAKLNAAGSALTYSTFWGGTGTERSNGIAVDASGNAYITGYTESTDYPTTNPLQASKGGTVAFKSTNGGGSWSPSATGLNASNINTLVVDPVTTTTVYAATNTGVYKSTNGGDNWSAANQGLSGFPVNDIALDRTAPATLYAATTTGVYKTTDGGANWNLLNNGLPAGQFNEYRRLAIDPVNHLTIYAGTYAANQVVYKSTDGGASWTPSDNGLPSAAVVLTLDIDPVNPANLYVSTGSNLYRSQNAGATWSVLNSGTLNGSVYALAIDPTNPARLYAGTDNGLYRSLNSGVSWTQLNVPAYYISSLIIDPNNNSILYAATNAGVFKSTDSGATWSGNALGFARDASIVLEINPSNTSIIYAGGYSGEDVLLTKFNPSGTGAVYSTYLGGGSHDVGVSVAADAAGNAYVTGWTGSANFPVANALQATHNPPAEPSDPIVDAFVAKVNPSGATLLYSTYLGGSGREVGQGIAVDASGNAYITGYTSSTNFPVFNPFQATCADCDASSYDAFVTKLNTSGSSVVYSSYFGGNGADVGNGIAVDAAGNAYLTGQTESSNLLILSAPQSTKGLRYDAFAAKVNDAGAAVVYSTYLGGSQDDIGTGIAVGPDGSAYVVGYTASNNFPLASALQPNYTGAIDSFVTRIGPSDSSGASADLSLTMTDSPDPVQSGQSITYTITVTNHGPSAASGVLVNDTIIQPQSVNSVSATPSQGACTPNLSCNLGNMASGAQATITVVIYPNVSGPASISNSATVGANEPDPVTSNNSATETTSIVVTFTIFGNITRGGNPLSGVTVTLSGSQSATVTTDVNGGYALTGLTPGGNYTVTPSLANTTFNPPNLVFNNLSQTFSGANFVGTLTPPTLQLNQSSYTIAEGAGSLAFLVNRSGDLSLPVTVNYTTTDAADFLQNCNVVNGKATSRCDYGSLVGTLHFAAGENSKTLFLPIVDDTYLEGSETLFITLSHATGGAVLGANQQATITITDNGNDAAGTANPIDGTDFFVRQHYIDFLGREPDPASIGWNNQINNCVPSQPSCDRLSVSQGIYNSPEFKDRGYFIYKFFSVALGRKPTYDEFVVDRARVSGFQSDAELEQSKVDFIADFMARPGFANTYNGLTNDQYVQTLFNVAGVTQVTVGGVVKDVAAMQQLMQGGRTRAQVLRDIAESPEVSARFLVESTIVMHYFGYLRRDPDAAYQDWINIYNQSGDSRNVTNGFVNSQEYRNRFGQ